MPFSSPNTPARQPALRTRSAAPSDGAFINHPDLRLLEHTFRMLPDVVSIYDVDAQETVYNNRPFALVLGYEDESTHDAFLHPDDIGTVNTQLPRTLLLNDDESVDISYRLRHANGTWKWFSERQVIFKRHMDGRVAQILKTARYDMGIAADLAWEREKSQRLSQFVGNLSHELRTPLAVIKTSLYLIKKTDDPLKQADRLQIIEYQVTQAARLSEQMTSLMRVEGLHDVRAATPVALNKILAKL